jgi:hypothetical protein
MGFKADIVRKYLNGKFTLNDKRIILEFLVIWFSKAYSRFFFSLIVSKLLLIAYNLDEFAVF